MSPCSWNVKRHPHNKRPQEDMFLALGFIDNFSEIYGLPLPGRKHNYRDSNVDILPPYISKSYVAQKYVESSTKFNQYFYQHRGLKNYGMN